MSGIFKAQVKLIKKYKKQMLGHWLGQL